MYFSCCCCFCCCCWGGGGRGNLATKGTKNVRLKEGGSVCMCPPLHLVQEPIQFNSILYSHYIRFLSYYYHRSVLQFLFAEYPPHSGADLGGGCRGGAPPPPRDDLRFSNTTGAPPPKKNPGSSPDIRRSREGYSSSLQKVFSQC